MLLFLETSGRLTQTSHSISLFFEIKKDKVKDTLSIG